MAETFYAVQTITEPSHDDSSSHLSEAATEADIEKSFDMEEGTKLPPSLPSKPEQYLVEFGGPTDPSNPLNWSLKRKAATGFFFGFSTLASTFASADVSPATEAISQQFHISSEVATLSTSTLFLSGYTIGPMLWAPLSEVKGRKLPAVIAMFGFILFAAAAATSKDTQTLMLCRFFQGLMGSAPISTTPAVYSDLFSPLHRGYVMSLFATIVFTGPMIAPFISGFTVQNPTLGWRWTLWWGFFFGLVGLLGLIFVAEETYSPVILTRKAADIRRMTGNYAIHAKHEEIEVDLQSFITKYLKRPLAMVATEPILLLVSIYTAFVYALLYAFLTSYTLVFLNGYGMTPGVSGLPFFGIVIGLLIALTVNILAQPHYVKRIIKNKGVYTPEWLMPLCLSGAISFPVGLFWFGWTGAYPQYVHWIVPTASGIFTGYGLLMIFMCSFTYLIVVYKQNAASAFGGNTIVRSAFAAGFPMFARQLFVNVGINWANTLLGCVAVLLIPVPICFYLYGAKIRSKSRFAP